MNNESPEQMVGLLKDLSVYKAMDNDYTASPKTGTEARNQRGPRCQQITLDMQKLATESKSPSS
jgi:hypothetical protein